MTVVLTLGLCLLGIVIVRLATAFYELQEDLKTSRSLISELTLNLDRLEGYVNKLEKDLNKLIS